MEDRFDALMGELGREVRQRNESLDNLQECIEGDIPKLAEAMKSATIEREDSDEAILKKISLETGRIRAQLAQERRQREESEQGTYDNLKDVVNRIKQEIDQERKAREETEETIMGLLEETCSKLLASSSSN